MSNETREQKTIKTIGGHDIVIKAYVTGRENNEIKAVLFEGVSTTGEVGEKPKIPMTLVIAHERKALEVLVISFDGVTDGAVDKLQDLPSSEYDEALKQIKTESKLSF